MNDLVDDLDGRLLSLEDLSFILRTHQKTCNDAWYRWKSLIYVGFGFNDGDDMFTCSAEWRDL